MSETVERRAVVPSLLATLGDRVLVVDRVQPVAVLLEPDGVVVSTVSWVDLVPQFAAAAVWPPRQLYTDGARAWVEERAERVIVELRVEHGVLRTSLAAAPSRGCQVSRTRLGLDLDLDLDADGRTWRWSSERDGFRRRVVATPGEGGSGIEIGVGAVVGGVAAGTSMIVAIRVAHQRPWSSAPPHRLLRVDAVTGQVTDLDLPSLPAAVWPAQNELAPGALADHLRTTVADCAELHRAGATDVAFSVSDPTGRPTIVTTFRMPGHDDVVFERHDEVVDELGRPSGGLDGFSVFLCEDLASGIVDRIIAEGRGPRL